MSDFDAVNIRKLDGGLLLVFRELLVRRRASDVAKQLGLSQSAISHALGRLRDVFGEPLFVRRSHGLEPTQRALDLAPAVERLLELMDAAIAPQSGFDPATSRRRFRLACPDHIATLVAPGLAAAFGRAAPLATFSTRYAVHDRALRAVQRREVDLALGAFSALPADLAAQTLIEDEYCVIARQGHPHIQGAIGLRAYAQTPHLYCGNPDGALSEDAPIDRPQMDATYGRLPVGGETPARGYVAQWETVMLTVSASDLIAECPRSLARRFAGPLDLQVLEPPYPPFRFTVQAVRRADVADAGVDWLLEQLVGSAE